MRVWMCVSVSWLKCIVFFLEHRLLNKLDDISETRERTKLPNEQIEFSFPFSPDFGPPLDLILIFSSFLLVIHSINQLLPLSRHAQAHVWTHKYYSKYRVTMAAREKVINSNNKEIVSIVNSWKGNLPIHSTLTVLLTLANCWRGITQSKIIIFFIIICLLIYFEGCKLSVICNLVSTPSEVVDSPRIELICEVVSCSKRGHSWRGHRCQYNYTEGNRIYPRPNFGEDAGGLHLFVVE